MKVYQGVVRGDWPGAVTVTENGRTWSLAHIVRHSPDGFSWGYGGSGPSDLALAILADVLGVMPAPATYQQFKFDVIATLDQDSNWTLTERFVRDWHVAHLQDRQ